MSLQRLDQFICEATGLTRKEAKRHIKAGLVLINDELCLSSNVKISPSDDDIELDGQLLSMPSDVYWVLYKPSDYCCSHENDGYPSLFQLLPEPLGRQKLHIAGRLDADTTGVVIISSNTDFCHKVMHPKPSENAQSTSCGKQYIVTLDRHITEEELQPIREGILLNGERKATLPSQAQLINDKQVALTLFEGKYHQVKRMFAAIGNHVTKLHRSSVGPVNLENLNEGDYRDLSTEELIGLGYKVPAIKEGSHG